MERDLVYFLYVFHCSTLTMHSHSACSSYTFLCQAKEKGCSFSVQRNRKEPIYTPNRMVQHSLLTLMTTQFQSVLTWWSFLQVLIAWVARNKSFIARRVLGIFSLTKMNKFSTWRWANLWLVSTKINTVYVFMDEREYKL